MIYTKVQSECEEKVYKILLHVHNRGKADEYKDRRIPWKAKGWEDRERDKRRAETLKEWKREEEKKIAAESQKKLEEIRRATYNQVREKRKEERKEKQRKKEEEKKREQIVGNKKRARSRENITWSRVNGKEQKTRYESTPFTYRRGRKDE